MTAKDCKVLEHTEIGGGYRYLVLEAGEMADAAIPGQFVHIRVPALDESALRRPFSIFDAIDGKFTLLYKTVGRGTVALNKVSVGDVINVMGPLGHGFPVKCEGTALLIGGGYGVAPLHLLARRLTGPKILFVGGRTKGDLLALDRFEKLGVEIRAATNDGSYGAKGFVTVPLDETIKKLSAAGEKFALFTCGPDGLLKAVADRALKARMPGHISMDRHMICGAGACYACIQKTIRGNSRCCIEGPVFKAEDLVW